ncbi:hypothetical protein Cgig2_030003 [Carnegiea gigantea]|uniref:F-box domain-containing protein n=1 Tax=Carnegiea gigantea TaxID=171969 RepID=A0A9Q1K7C4_9CARY|nr:hypothetical protein Cgig2_030003 [Carnegiea gigantea]
MASHTKKTSNGKNDHVDRISNLPDFVLLHILSFLDTREACRVSILSKEWTSVWRTASFLDFQIDCFIVEKFDSQGNVISDKYDWGYYDNESVHKPVGCRDCVMLRCSKEHLCIRIFSLEFPMLDPNLAFVIDKNTDILPETLKSKFNAPRLEDFGPPTEMLVEILKKKVKSLQEPFKDFEDGKDYEGIRVKSMNHETSVSRRI